MQQRNQLIRKSNGDWIKLAAKAGSPLTVYGSAAASYEFKEWRISNARLDQQIGATGAPRSAFGSDVLVVGSAEAAALAEEISRASANLDKALLNAANGVERLVEQKRADEAEIAKRKETIEQERQRSILAAVAKGRRYEGRWGTQPIAIEFIECNAPGTLFRARVYNPADPKLSRFYSGAAVFDSEKARGYPIHLSGETPASGSNLPLMYVGGGGRRRNCT